MRLAQSLLGIRFENPTVLASGKWGIDSQGCRKAIDGGAGAVTIKSLSTLTRSGHPDPVLIQEEHFTLNAVGLPSFGPDYLEEEFGSLLKERPVPILVSIFGGTAEDFGKAAEVFARSKPDAFEANISCPNTEDDFGRPFAYSPKDAAAAVRSLKTHAGNIPVFVKLSPNIEDISAIARACIEAGADGFTLINTFGPGMAIDIKTRKPILSNKSGGISGPAIKPIAVRCVAEVYKAIEGKFPIIGTGGVVKGEDAIELMLAGASLIGIGTAVLTQGYGIFKKVCKELEAWCEKEGVKDIAELTGAMHWA